MTLPRVAWLLLPLLPVGACTNGAGDSIAQCGAFGTSLFVKDRMDQAANVFNADEPITFELSISNTRNTPATLTAGSSCMAVVFEIFDAAQMRRWGSADRIACIQMLQPRTYAPLEAVSESAAWNQQGSDSGRVAPGEYVVTAAVGQYVSDAGEMVDCRAELSKSATFRIQ